MRPPPRPRRVAPVQARRSAASVRSSPSQVDDVRLPEDGEALDRRESDRPGVSDSALVVPPRGWRPVRPAVVSSGSAARFAERVEQRRRLAQRRTAIGGGALAAALLLGWALLVSPLLALDVQEVELRGEGTVVDAAAVAAVIATHDRTPLPRLDTVGLRRAILEVPGVRAAEVARVTLAADGVITGLLGALGAVTGDQDGTDATD